MSDSPPVPFAEGDYLATAVLVTPDASGEVSAAAAPVVLTAGRYAAVFGSGQFSVLGSAITAGVDANIGSPEYLSSSDSGGSWTAGLFVRGPA